MRTSLIILLSAMGVASAAAQMDDYTMGASKQVDPAEEYAAELLLPFKRDLKSALVAGMANGADAAIDACKLEAPAIAERLSIDGVAVGRTSHRLRNPANTAPEWVTPILKEYLAGTGEWQPRVVELEAGRSGYVEPIQLQPLCLNCHGETLAPEVVRRLDELYPQDAATGFEVADRR